MRLPPFHLAIPVDNLTAVREFYGGVLGCAEGRSAASWVDFNFFGHQLVCHCAPELAGDRAHNEVDGEQVPVPHFGVVLAWDDWQRLADRLTAAAAEFIVEPNIRFAGQSGEQATLFLADPAGNVLEIKAMRDAAKLFEA